MKNPKSKKKGKLPKPKPLKSAATKKATSKQKKPVVPDAQALRIAVKYATGKQKQQLQKLLAKMPVPAPAPPGTKRTSKYSNSFKKVNLINSLLSSYLHMNAAKTQVDVPFSKMVHNMYQGIKQIPAQEIKNSFEYYFYEYSGYIPKLLESLTESHVKEKFIDLQNAGLTNIKVVENLYTGLIKSDIVFPQEIEENFEAYFDEFSGIQPEDLIEVAESIPYYYLENELGADDNEEGRPIYDGFKFKLRVTYQGINGELVDSWFPETEKFDSGPTGAGEKREAIQWYLANHLKAFRALEKKYREQGVTGFYPYFQVTERKGNEYLYYHLKEYVDGEEKYTEWAREQHGIVVGTGKKGNKTKEDRAKEEDELINQKILEKEKEKDKEQKITPVNQELEKTKLDIELSKQREKEEAQRERTTQAEIQKLKEVQELLKAGFSKEEIMKLLGK